MLYQSVWNCTWNYTTMDRSSPKTETDSKTEQDAWRNLISELDLWQAEGLRASFWWRDDDAATTGPQLERLLALSVKTNAPIALATIPARAGKELADAIHAHPTACVLQHGYAHVNHAAGSGDVGAWELGRHRPLSVVLQELSEGRQILFDLFSDDSFVPVMVPPWNRIDAEVIAPLASLGFVGLSLCDARTAPEAAPGLRLVNAHCDPIKWRGGPRFTGTAKSIAQLTEHLSARRLGTADSAEPTGLLTHHIDHDDAVWRFCEDLLAALNNHPAAYFVTPKELFPS